MIESPSALPAELPAAFVLQHPVVERARVARSDGVKGEVADDWLAGVPVVVADVVKIDLVSRRVGVRKLGTVEQLLPIRLVKLVGVPGDERRVEQVALPAFVSQQELRALERAAAVDPISDRDEALRAVDQFLPPDAHGRLIDRFDVDKGIEEVVKVAVKVRGTYVLWSSVTSA